MERQDGHICRLELCAIALGLCTFADEAAGHKLRVWSDNKGAEYSTARGSTKAWDHSHVVHAILVKAAMLRAHMVADRVPTKENLSDLPSREEYCLLDAMKSVFVTPLLDEMLWTKEAWSTAPLCGALRRKARE